MDVVFSGVRWVVEGGATAAVVVDEGESTEFPIKSVTSLLTSSLSLAKWSVFEGESPDT